jgi:hypothetical protein
MAAAGAVANTFPMQERCTGLAARDWRSGRTRVSAQAIRDRLPNFDVPDMPPGGESDVRPSRLRRREGDAKVTAARTKIIPCGV